MNYELDFIPERPERPRDSGLTMVMDKGLSTRQAEDLIDSSADYVDLVKLGFGTSAFSNNLTEKIKLYHDAGMKVYL
jgi:phosphosulfolactate synthase